MRSVLVMASLLLAYPQVHAASLHIDGEVYARRSAQLLPPQSDDIWQFNITQLAPDGSRVKKGQVVVAFDGSTLVKTLAEKSSKLEEKHREREKLNLDLAERERMQHLKTEQARAELEKAQRKTEQPQELIAGMAYRKLVVARELAQHNLDLAQRSERAAAEQRLQERRLLDAETAQLQADVNRISASLAALNVQAPRDGLMMHKSNFSGQKFDVGNQVWKGQSVAEIPDIATLAIRAQLPERDFRQVHAGMAARVRIEGSGSVYPGKVASVGRAVRSKSTIQPIPILDVEITLDRTDERLKPGISVRVELVASANQSKAG